MTPAKFAEVCQEMSEAFSSEWKEETFFSVWEFLEPSWYSCRDSIFSSSSFCFVELFALEIDPLDFQEGLQRRRFSTSVFTENCALKAVLDSELFEDFFLVTCEVPL